MEKKTLEIIRIEEKSVEGEVFEARVILNEQQFAVVIENPHSSKTAGELEWYFETYISEPYTPGAAIDICKDVLRTYGESLFKQIFSAHKDIYFHYRDTVRQKTFEDIVFEIVGDSTDFHSVLWESLKDPDFDAPLAAQGAVFFRKNLKPRLIEARVDRFPYINLLIVTARPDEEDDVNYRTIQRPLIDVVKHSKLKVKPYILRPGTFRSLVDHLDERGKGFYHIVHFDLHGGLVSYEHLKKASKTNKVVFQTRYALEDMKPFKGKRAFLFFETDKKGVALPVEASEMAALLETKHIPVCILNACQSAKQEKSDHETSYGLKLVEKGIQLVLAMRYSVSVTAAEIVMETLYEKLFDYKSVETAISLGRRRLYNQKNRGARFGQQVELEDWVLPVVYKNRDVDFNLRPFTGEEEETFYTELEKKHVFHPPRYGFHGRDLDILKIEKMVLGHNHMLLQGMGGAGKTTLLDYLAWWWQETGFVKKAFYFPYDKKAWTVRQIIHEIAGKTYSESEWNTFIHKSFVVQKGKVLETLNTERYVLILDNTESITGEKLAIRNTLNQTERNELKDFLSKITGKTFVLLGSRSEENWLKDITFLDNVCLLRGFDEDTAFNFAKKIITALELDFGKMVQDLHFRRLMALLAGYPLALQVVLPKLKSGPPETIFNDLKAGDVSLDEKDTQERTHSIIKCIEYSHSNLSEGAQKLLLCLAPFQSAVNLHYFDEYFVELKKSEVFEDYPFDKMDDVVREAVQGGLMQEAAPDFPMRIMTLQPAFTYFLKDRLNRLPDKILARDLDTAFTAYFDAMAEAYLAFLNSQKAEDRQMGFFLTQFEYENFLTALEKLLARKGSIIRPLSVIDCLLQRKNNHRDRLKVSETVLSRLETYPPEKLKGTMGMEIISILDMVGNIYCEMCRFQDARRAFLKAVALYNAHEGNSEFTDVIGGTYKNLGAALMDLGDFEESKFYFDKALDIFVKTGNKLGQIHVYQNLGVASSTLGNYKESISYLKQALEICRQIEADYLRGETYQSLGVTFIKLGNYEESMSYYKKASEIFLEFEDKHKLGGIYQNLGVIASRLKDYEKSKSYSKKALRIFLELDDKYTQATVYQCLGHIALEEGCFAESKSYFEKSFEVYILSRNKRAVANLLGNVKILADTSGDGTVLDEMMKRVALHFSKKEVEEILSGQFIESPPEE